MEMPNTRGTSARDADHPLQQWTRIQQRAAFRGHRTSEGDINVARPQLRAAPGKMRAAGLIIEGMSVLVRMLFALWFRTIRGGRETGVVQDAKRMAWTLPDFRKGNERQDHEDGLPIWMMWPRTFSK